MRYLWTILLLSTALLAQLSEEQLDYYYQVSGEKQYYDYLTSPKRDAIFYSTINAKKSEASPAYRREFEGLLHKPILEKTYKNTFKTMDQRLYKEIIDFYETPTGKKYAKSKLHRGSNGRTLPQLIEQYNHAVSEGRLSKADANLVKKINISFDEYNLTIEYIKKIYITDAKQRGSDLKANLKITDSYLEPTKKGIIYISALSWIDFTQNELEDLYQYASTDAGRQERKYMFEAYYRWTALFQKMAIEHLDTFSTIQFCQQFSTKEYPSFCKKEWLPDAQILYENNETNQSVSIPVL